MARASLDVRQVACPLSWVRTRIALEQLGPGDELEVLLADGEALESVPRSAELDGHRIAARAAHPQGGWRVVLVRCRAEARPTESWEA